MYFINRLSVEAQTTDLIKSSETNGPTSDVSTHAVIVLSIDVNYLGQHLKPTVCYTITFACQSFTYCYKRDK